MFDHLVHRFARRVWTRRLWNRAAGVKYERFSATSRGYAITANFHPSPNADTNSGTYVDANANFPAGRFFI